MQAVFVFQPPTDNLETNVLLSTSAFLLGVIRLKGGRGRVVFFFYRLLGRRRRRGKWKSSSQEHQQFPAYIIR